jgi:hypothetical protein
MITSRKTVSLLINTQFQLAFWFQNRDKMGLKISWPSGAEYRGFATFDLLPSVSATLLQYRRLV